MRLIPLLLVLFMVSSGAGCTDSSQLRETPTEKMEWSLLQGAEVTSRGQAISGPEFQSVEGYELMAVPAATPNAGRIWIMLSPKSPPYYKQMPHGNYAVSESLVRQLASTSRVSATVEEVLWSHIGRQ